MINNLLCFSSALLQFIFVGGIHNHFESALGSILINNLIKYFLVGKPRYVRVNTLSCSVNEAIENFCEEGWSFTKFLDKKNYQGFLEKVLELQENEFMPDIHIPDLLIFPCKTQFYRHPAYKNGSIILQDKVIILIILINNFIIQITTIFRRVAFQSIS